MNYKLKAEGDIIESIVDLEGDMGLVHKRGSDSFEIACMFDTPSIIFPRCHTACKFIPEKKKEQYEFDVYSILLIPAGVEYTLKGNTTVSDITILLPAETLLQKAAEFYKITRKEFSSLFEYVRMVPRNNWCNEMMHRYVFERKDMKNKANTVTNFLELEILKEIFYLNKDKDILSRSRFDLDKHNFNKKKAIIRKALIYIESNLFKEMDMNEISKSAGSNNSSILKAFKEECKKTPFEYITDRRMEETICLLKSRQFTVSEIAERVGYKDVSAFIKAFKKKYGKTPGTF